LAGWFLSALALLVGLLPWRALAAAGSAVGWFAGSVLRVRREQVEGAMTAAGVESPSREAVAMYDALGRSALEFLWLARRGGDLAPHVTIDPRSAERWRAALAGGRGVVIAASHTGNWDLAACAIAREVELLVVTKHLRVASVDRFWQSTRAGQGVTLAGAEGALARGRAVLRRGGAVAMMIDQAPSSRRHAVPIEFLGRPALADRAPAALAAAARAPLVVAAARRAASGAHLLEVLRVIEPPSSKLARSWIAPATVAAGQALEAFVRAHPDQWLWLHRRWKQPEPDLRTVDAAASRTVDAEASRTNDAEASRTVDAEASRATAIAPAPGVDPATRAATLAPPWSKIRSSSPGEASKVD
jgi:KDO2-lipid IV(A) lauroyltransferase